MDNKELITKFYTAFSNKDSHGMIECYHKDIVFQDPAFGKLKGERAGKMWEMLLSKKDSDTKIVFRNTEASLEIGKAYWIATYTYSPTQRKVINKVTASFKFRDGLIIEHTDSFNLWKWTKQALGPIGFLLGWSTFMRKKIQTTANASLDKYISKS